MADTTVAHKDDCQAMASALEELFDRNEALLLEMNDPKLEGKKLPREMYAVVLSRQDEINAARAPCVNHPGFQSAMAKVSRRAD